MKYIEVLYIKGNKLTPAAGNSSLKKSEKYNKIVFSTNSFSLIDLGIMGCDTVDT